MHEAFESVEDDHLQFDRIENPLSLRPDVCAFLLLDKLVPPTGKRDMIAASGHDTIALATDCEALAGIATPEDIRTLRRCGVWYDDDEDCLKMFT